MRWVTPEDLDTLIAKVDQAYRERQEIIERVRRHEADRAAFDQADARFQAANQEIAGAVDAILRGPRLNIDQSPRGTK